MSDIRVTRAIGVIVSPLASSGKIKMRTVRSSVLVLLLSTASAMTFAVTAQAQLSIDVRVNIAPPPLPFYEQPVIPAEGYLWIPGFWAWDEAQADYYWVPGTWVEPPQRELLWTPAYWGWMEGRYVFYPGYWAREVGFYGGIDYGYGYPGEGYFGGRWDNGAFFYNRSVNNVESVRITNVYSQTVVVNKRANNVSFNGGNGGTTVRPSAQQQAIAREPHVAATQLQRQQVEAASKDRGLFSKQNHGEPAVAATPRAGVFQGAGVSRGSRAPVAARPANETPANGAMRPGSVENKEAPPARADEKLTPAQQPREAQPTPRAEEPREPSRTEEPRRPTEELPKAQEPQRPMQEPKAAERPAQEPRVEEQRRPAEEPPMRAQEQARPAQAPAQPRVNEARPAPQAVPQRPPAARPPAEEKR
jgi:hypothetical protein